MLETEMLSMLAQILVCRLHFILLVVPGVTEVNTAKCSLPTLKKNECGTNG